MLFSNPVVAMRRYVMITCLLLLSLLASVGAPGGVFFCFHGHGDWHLPAEDSVGETHGQDFDHCDGDAANDGGEPCFDLVIERLGWAHLQERSGFGAAVPFVAAPFTVVAVDDSVPDDFRYKSIPLEGPRLIPLGVRVAATAVLRV